MRPVLPSIVTPGGKPVAPYEIASPSGSVAVTCSEMAAGVTVVRFPIAATTGGRFTFVTVHVKVRLVLSDPSLTVTVAAP
jgi:hypothetical protein